MVLTHLLCSVRDTTLILWYKDTLCRSVSFFVLWLLVDLCRSSGFDPFSDRSGRVTLCFSLARLFFCVLFSFHFTCSLYPRTLMCQYVSWSLQIECRQVILCKLSFNVKSNVRLRLIVDRVWASHSLQVKSQRNAAMNFHPILLIFASLAIWLVFYCTAQDVGPCRLSESEPFSTTDFQR